MRNTIVFKIPIRTISEANARGHWAKFKKLHDSQKDSAFILAHTALRSLPETHPLRNPEAAINIGMTRVAKGNFMDSDNLPASMKYIRDGVASALAPGMAPGRADGLSRFAWTYDQKRTRGAPEVRVTLEIYKHKNKTPDIRLYPPARKTASAAGPWDGTPSNVRVRE